MRGHNPMLAIVDDGIDIVLENGKTLQVKTITVAGYKTRPNSASTNVTHIGWEAGRRIKKIIPPKADYFVIWVVPWNEFFILPKGEVEKRTRTVCITKN